MKPVVSVIILCSIVTGTVSAQTANTTRTTDTLTLKEVLVQGKRPIVERKTDRTIVHVDNMITSAGTSALELLKKMPGVQVSPEGQITLNGRSGVNIFIDGRPTYVSAGDLVGLLSALSASGVQSVEIITNPSAQFDAGGTGGIINIVKKRNRKEGFTGAATVVAGQGYYGTYKGSLGLSYKHAWYNLTLDNSYTYSKDLFARTVTADILEGGQTLLTRQISNNDDVTTLRAYTPSLGVDLYLSGKTTLSLTGDLSVRTGDDKTLSTMSTTDGNGSKTGSVAFSGLNGDAPLHDAASIFLTHRFDTTGQEFSLALDYANYTNQPRQRNTTLSYDASGNFLDTGLLWLDESRELRIYAAKADYTRPLRHGGSIAAGYKSSYVSARNDNTDLSDSSQSDYSVNTENINAAYLNMEKPFKKMTVEAGLRLEQTATKGTQTLSGVTLHQNYWQLFPTLFVDYAAGPHSGFTLRLGRRTDRADYSEMVPFRRPQTPTLYFQGNPNLQPDLTYHGELAYTWRSMLSLTLGYDIDHNFIRTLPYLDSNKVTVTRIPTNIQGARSWNVDLSYNAKPLSWWTTDNTLSLYQNAFSGQAGGFSLDNRGMPAVYLSLVNSLQCSPALSAEIDLQYNSRRQLVTSSFGPYSVLSIGLRKQFWKSRGILSLNANNIFQAENHDAIDHYENLNQYSYWYFHTRWVKLQFTYRFGSSKFPRHKTETAAGEEEKRAGN